jgi:hypothetical protein
MYLKEAAHLVSLGVPGRLWCVRGSTTEIGKPTHSPTRLHIHTPFLSPLLTTPASNLIPHTIPPPPFSSTHTSFRFSLELMEDDAAAAAASENGGVILRKRFRVRVCILCCVVLCCCAFFLFLICVCRGVFVSLMNVWMSVGRGRW